MSSFEQLIEAAEDKIIKELDFSSFARQDAFNLILQRSEIIRDHDIKQKSPVISAWLQGDAAPGYALVDQMGDQIMRRAAAIIWLEYQEIRPTLESLKPSSLADIGCGYAIFDLFYWRDFPGRVLLIDIEANDDRHFGFAQNGAAYSNLDVARSFLMNNGVNDSDIHCVNPQNEDLSLKQPVDLAVSFVSCGYHYPSRTYRAFFETGVTPQGSVILDLRRKKTAEELEGLQGLGTFEEIAKGANGTARRILLSKQGQRAAG